MGDDGLMYPLDDNEWDQRNPLGWDERARNDGRNSLLHSLRAYLSETLDMELEWEIFAGTFDPASSWYSPTLCREWSVVHRYLSAGPQLRRLAVLDAASLLQQALRAVAPPVGEQESDPERRRLSAGVGTAIRDLVELMEDDGAPWNSPRSAILTSP